MRWSMKPVERERGWIERIESGDDSMLVDSDEKLRELGCLVLARAGKDDNGTEASR